MAKNFVQEGKTIPLVNSGKAEIISGDVVTVGAIVAVAITDIAPGFTGDGFTDGVFILPKLPADNIPAGSAVFIKDGKIQLDKTSAVAAGIAWEPAGTNVTVIEVKINA